MKDYRSLFVLAVVFTVVSVGFGVVGVAQLTYIINSKCVTGLTPNTCSNGGNSACYAVGTAGEGSSCSYCDGPASMPAKYCVGWEGEICYVTSSYTSPCSGYIRKYGECQNGACAYTNNTPTNEVCAPSTTYVCNQ